MVVAILPLLNSIALGTNGLLILLKVPIGLAKEKGKFMVSFLFSG
jgi:hypothetical protein